jgi:hypothetical protein
MLPLLLSFQGFVNSVSGVLRQKLLARADVIARLAEEVRRRGGPSAANNLPLLFE